MSRLFLGLLEYYLGVFLDIDIDRSIDIKIYICQRNELIIPEMQNANSVQYNITTKQATDLRDIVLHLPMMGM